MVEEVRRLKIDSLHNLPIRVSFWQQKDEVLHCHDFYELAFVTKGQGIHVLDKEEYSVSSGDVFIIRPDIEHKYKATNNLEIINLLYFPESLGIPTPEMNNLAGYRAFFEVSPYVQKTPEFKSRLILNSNQLLMVKNLLTEMSQELIDQQPGFDFMLKTSFLFLIGLLSRVCEKQEHEDAYTLMKLNRILSFIENNFCKPITVDDIAQIGKMSRSSLNRLFRKALGQSTWQYLMDFRLEKACAMLRETDRSISEIAFATGFNDSNYFAKNFRANFNLSPSEYHKKHRHDHAF